MPLRLRSCFFCMGLNFQSVAFQHLGDFSGRCIELLAELVERHMIAFNKPPRNRFGKTLVKGQPIGFQNGMFIPELFDQADRAAVVRRQLCIGFAMCDVLFSHIVFVKSGSCRRFG